MKNMYDIQQLLKRFGIVIYTGNRVSDLQLMDLEIAELFKMQLITKEEFVTIKQIIQQEISNPRG